MNRKLAASTVFLAVSLVASALAQSSAPQANQRGVQDLLARLGLLSTPSTPSTAMADADRAAGSASDAVALGQAQAKSIAFSSVDYPGAAFSVILDANASTAVGTYTFDPVNGTFPLTAFTLKGTTYKTLSISGSTMSYLSGINTSGQMVGVYGDSSGNEHGFFDNGGTLTNVDFPGATSTRALELNDSAEIVGTYVEAGSRHGFLDKAGTFTTLDFPGASSTIAYGLNSTGDIVGYWSDSAKHLHGFLLSKGTYTGLDFPLATDTSALGINDSGAIAGYYTDTAGTLHGFTYAKGTFTSVNVVGAQGAELIRIKNNGTLTGEFIDIMQEGHGMKGH